MYYTNNLVPLDRILEAPVGSTRYVSMEVTKAFAKRGSLGEYLTLIAKSDDGKQTYVQIYYDMNDKSPSEKNKFLLGVCEKINSEAEGYGLCGIDLWITKKSSGTVFYRVWRPAIPVCVQHK